MAAESGNGGQWKWIAGILAALMIGFLPGYISSRDAPSKSQFEQLRQSQEQTQLKLAVLAVQNRQMLKSIDEARRRIVALQQKHQ